MTECFGIVIFQIYNTENYVLYIVVLGLLALMGMCSACLCWQKTREQQRIGKNDDKKNVEATVSIRANTSMNHASNIMSMSPRSASSPALRVPVNDSCHDESNVTDGHDVEMRMQSPIVVTRGSEGGGAGASGVANENEGLHLQVERQNLQKKSGNSNLYIANNNSGNLLLGDYTQEGSDGEDNFNEHVHAHGVTIAEEKRNNGSDYNYHVGHGGLPESAKLAGLGDTVRNKGEMFKQDLNDEVVVENALMDDIVGHMATAGKSNV